MVSVHDLPKGAVQIPGEIGHPSFPHLLEVKLPYIRFGLIPSKVNIIPLFMYVSYTAPGHDESDTRERSPGLIFQSSWSKIALPPWLMLTLRNSAKWP